MEKATKNHFKQLTYIVTISMVIVLFFTGYSIGKTINQTTIKGEAAFAQPVLEVLSDSDIKITDAQSEGECSFVVRNYNKDNKKTEVGLQYTVQIIDTLSPNLKNTIQYELYKNGNIVELKNGLTSKMEMTNQKNQEDTYTLKIKYDKNQSLEMGDILDKVQIQVHSEQCKI